MTYINGDVYNGQLVIKKKVVGLKWSGGGDKYDGQWKAINQKVRVMTFLPQ